MSVGGFTLADRLGAKSVPCRVAGCSRTWLQLSNKALALGGGQAADPHDPAAGMCEPCRKKWGELKDQQRPCERPGCANTWTWPAKAQLEAFATRRPPPRGLCADCETQLAGLEAKEVPCSVPGCARVAVVTPRQQLMNGTDGTGVRCAECEDVSHRIKDRQVNCGITSCNRKWTWRTDEQLQAFAAGKPPEPPRRMCDECRAEFGKLLDREVRCRTSGCKKTWTWSRSDQLDACVAGKAAPKAPARMCESCFQIFQNVKDVERPCRRAGCKGTWLDKRGAQLARAVRGKTGDPFPRYCAECEKELGDLQDREISCKTEGCPGTWTWTKEQQLAAGVRPKKMIEADEQAAAAVASAAAAAAAAAEPTPAADGAAHDEAAGDAAPTNGAAAPEAAPAAAARPPGQGKRNRRNKRRREPQPPDRRCSACVEFLAGRKTQEIPCTQCNTPIYWPPESQLQTHLGNWAAPSLCGACKRDATEAARKAAKEALRAQLGEQAAAAAVDAAPPAAEAPPPPEPST